MTPLLAIRLQQLAYLDALEQYGHYGDAAEHLLVSQSALTQGLQRLEQAIGSPLVQRQGRGHRLTMAGNQTLEFARRVLADAHRLDSTLTARREGRAGTLRVGLVDAAALYLLKDQLQDFRNSHPKVELQLTVETSGRLLERLDQRAVDLAIVVGPAPDETAIEVAREALYVYGPQIESLDQVDRWILYPTLSKTRRYIDEALAQLKLAPRAPNESSNPSVIAQLVRLGEGWTVLPAGIAESLIDPLTRRSEAITERVLFAVRATNVGPDSLVDRFIEGLQENDL